MISSNIFFASFILYFIAFFLYIIGLSKENKEYMQGFRFSVIAFIVHTLGLLVRYYEAGIVELKAFEESTGHLATGSERIRIMLSHPPFTNLYESMIFVLWGIAIVYIVINRRFHLNIIGLLGSALIVIGMGLSNLLPDKSITPLIPALKSWWLHLHVITASLAYGAFLIAAVVALLYLIRENISPERMFAVFLFTTAVLVLMMVSFNPLKYGATLLGVAENGKLRPAVISVMLDSQTNPLSIVLKRPSLLIGLVSLITIIISLAGGILLITRKISARTACPISSAILLVYLVSLLFSVSSHDIGTDKRELAELINYSLSSAGINSSNITNMNFNILPPYRINLSSFPYQFSIILMLFLTSLFFLYLIFRYDSFIRKLPQSSVLDTISYRTVLFAFPMMTFVILTGAVWAHFAWGRYWGWDPKETWSLITWLVYAFYLHSRHTLRWSGKRAAIIAVIGFAVVIFTYIGVNLGLTGSGLHVYGSK